VIAPNPDTIAAMRAVSEGGWVLSAQAATDAAVVADRLVADAVTAERNRWRTHIEEHIAYLSECDNEMACGAEVALRNALAALDPEGER
jgi:hypothetical protein